MLNDYILIPYEFKTKNITIVPLADLHIGAKSCRMNDIKKILKEIETSKNTYCVLAGDVIDNGIIAGKGLGVYDNKCSPMEQIKNCVELLRPLAKKGKILAVVSGNHEDRTTKFVDVNPLYLICSELGIQDVYRDSLAIVKIQLGSVGNNEGVCKRQTYTIMVHHGKGSSETAIKKDHDFINSFEGADVIITGHTHNGRIAKFNKKFINKQNNIVTDREITCIVCNSFLDDASYALKSMLVGTSNSIISFDIYSGKSKKIITHI